MATEANGTGPDPSGRSDFERFEAFLKKLVAVPKGEVEALRKRERLKRHRDVKT